MIETFLSFILVALILVTFHELGHFLVGLVLKAKIQEFSIGFGPELLSFPMGNYGRFSIRIILFGGYVRFFEDRNNPSLSFNHLAPWRRMCIALAGPIFNVILSLLVFTGIIYWHGYSKIPNLNVTPIAGVVAGGPSSQAGIKSGDTLLKANGIDLKDFKVFAQYIQKNKTHLIHFLIKRKGKTLNIDVIPKKVQRPNIFGKKVLRYVVGIYPPKSITVYPNFLKSWVYGSKMLYHMVFLTIKGLGLLVTGNLSLSNVSGPIGIAKISHTAVQMGMIPFLMFLSFFSINLAVFNLLPLPILDGGVFLLALIEWIRKKPLPANINTQLIFFSLAVLVSLVIFFTIIDLSKP